MIKCFHFPKWHIRRKAIFKSLICFAFVLLSTEAKTQTPTPTPTYTPLPTPPSHIPAGSGGSARGTFYVPSSTSAKLTVDIAEPDAIALGHLKLMVYPGETTIIGTPPPGAPITLLWDQEQLLNSSHQLVESVHLVANLPFAGAPGPSGTFTYSVQAIDNTFGQQNGTVGTLLAASLTLNPTNPGHIGPPIVNLFGGANNEPVPTSITFGSNLNVVATAICSNPASYKITRLGIKITEILNNEQPYLNHNSGLGAEFYAPPEVMQPASSNSVLELPYTPPILPPGSYQIVVTAWDSAGFKSSLSKTLTVTRLFGLFSVTDPVGRHVNPDNSMTFTATLNLANHTAVASGNLRIRLIKVAGSAFTEDVGPPELPPPAPLSGAMIGQVTPLLPQTAEAVLVSGIAPPPEPAFPPPFNASGSGIGYQIYALLESSLGGTWIKLDSIKVTEGVWPTVGFPGSPPGPGLGTVAPRLGIGGTTSDPQLKVFKNISTRCKVLTGDNVLIGGFIVTGNTAEKVIIRAIGPSLQVNGTPIAGRLLDPILELHKPDGTVVTNDNWRSSQATEIQATGIPPQSNLESAIVATLAPNAPNQGYTAIVRGKNNGTGIGLVEVYDIGPTTDSQVINISSRGFVSNGNDVMIGGIIVGGSGKVLARAIGPSLPSSIPNRLQDPILELHNDNGALIASNDNWKTNQAAIQATGAAPTNDHESAIVTTLLPGNYTAIVKGKNNGAGVGLVECYNVQ